MFLVSIVLQWGFICIGSGDSGNPSSVSSAHQEFSSFPGHLKYSSAFAELDRCLLPIGMGEKKEGRKKGSEISCLFTPYRCPPMDPVQKGFGNPAAFYWMPAVPARKEAYRLQCLEKPFVPYLGSFIFSNIPFINGFGLFWKFSSNKN